MSKQDDLNARKELLENCIKSKRKILRELTNDIHSLQVQHDNEQKTISEQMDELAEVLTELLELTKSSQ